MERAERHRPAAAALNESHDMLAIQPSSPRAASGDAAGPGATTIGEAPPPGGADPAGFASLLRRSQAVPAPTLHAPPPQPAPVAPPGAAPEPDAAVGAWPAPDPDASAASDGIALPARGAIDRARARAIDVARGDGRAAAARAAKAAIDAPAQQDPSTAPAAQGNASANGQIGVDAAAIDPGIAHWLAGLQQPAARRGDDPATHDARDGKHPSSEAGAAIDTGAAPRAAQSATLVAPDDKRRVDTAHTGMPAGDKHVDLVPPAELRAADTPPSTPARTLVSIGDTLASAAHAIATPPLLARTEAAAPVVVALATPLAAAEFAHALGLQMSVLARAGVQHAELQLHPAEMGPVSVQIAIEGTQARIHFGADVAATRQAIEAGLPELASALRDAGFTLAGGGVSQHSRGRGGDDEPARPGARRMPDAQGIEHEAAAQRVSRRAVRLGGLDLYA